MPTIETSIEIAASPSAVRAVLLDWPSYPSWNDNFRIAPPEGKKPEETQIKDALKVEVVGGMKFSPSVTVSYSVFPLFINVGFEVRHQARKEIKSWCG
jgi:hypothetical protein